MNPTAGSDHPQTEIDALLGADVLERLDKPTAEGTALPNVAYTSEAFHRLENERLFRRTWAFAGFGHRIPKAGDAMPAEVAGQPLILARGRDGRVRVFHNVCRHRGAKLLTEAATGLRNFTCPNHSWSYDLDGHLRARPHFFGGDKHEAVRGTCHRADLVPVRCAAWHDWIFVNLDGRAEAFETYIKPLADRVAEYDFSTLGHGGTLTFDLKADWKLAFENFIEPYHVFSCHPWLHSFVTMKERTAPAFDGHLLYCGYSFQATDPARGEGLPYFPGLSEARRRRGDWFVLFPNFAFEVFPDQVDVFVAHSLGAGRCREEIVCYFVGEGATSPDYAAARQAVLDNWQALNEEDIGIVERMQEGRRSDGFDGGVLSPYWDPVLQQFSRLVVEAMR
ncbi:MAG: aromatic ring-hydroxylating dioxygenase subunit alpha [Proteobacteria bacterium]|nr:aromatic ring-hydroxylating dioxygenase subunit alpha [Pseudomonadota bacterium]